MTRFLPIIMMILGIGVLSLMDALVKTLTGSYPVWQITFLRYVLGFAVIVPILFAMRPERPSWPVVRANGFRGVLVVGATVCFFYSIRHIPLALATSLFFTAPLMIAVLGWFMLGERISRAAFMAIGLGLAGVVVICVGTLFNAGFLTVGAHAADPDLVIGLVFALVAACCYAIAMVTIRARTRNDPILIIIVLQTVGGAIVSAVPGLAVWQPLAFTDLSVFVLIGACGTCGFFLLSGALARAPVATLAPIEYGAFLWASLWGFLFFTEVPEQTTVLGAAMIVVAGLLVLRQQSPAVVEPV